MNDEPGSGATAGSERAQLMGTAPTESWLQSILDCSYFRAEGATSIELLRMTERPVSRVYQVRVQLRCGARLFWVKQHTEKWGSAESEYQFLKDARDRYGDDTDLSMLNPVAYLPNIRAFVTEHHSGQPLSGLIKHRLNRISALPGGNRGVWKHCYTCGSWLAQLHSDRLGIDDLYAPELLVDYVSERLQILVDRGLDPGIAQRVEASLDRTLEGVGPEDFLRVRTHGDYAPYNVLVSDAFVVHDPDVGGYFGRLHNYCPRYEDIVHFHDFVLQMSPPLISLRTRRRMARLFLEGYRSGNDLPVVESSAAFRAFRLKYKVLQALGGDHSLLGRLSTVRSRARAFRRWFEAAE